MHVYVGTNKASFRGELLLKIIAGLIETCCSFFKNKWQIIAVLVAFGSMLVDQSTIYTIEKVAMFQMLPFFRKMAESVGILSYEIRPEVARRFLAPDVL